MMNIEFLRGSCQSQHSASFYKGQLNFAPDWRVLPMAHRLLGPRHGFRVWSTIFGCLQKSCAQILDTGSTFRYLSQILYAKKKERYRAERGMMFDTRAVYGPDVFIDSHLVECYGGVTSFMV